MLKCEQNLINVFVKPNALPSSFTLSGVSICLTFKCKVFLYFHVNYSSIYDDTNGLSHVENTFFFYSKAPVYIYIYIYANAKFVRQNIFFHWSIKEKTIKVLSSFHLTDHWISLLLGCPFSWTSLGSTGIMVLCLAGDYWPNCWNRHTGTISLIFSTK